MKPSTIFYNSYHYILLATVIVVIYNLASLDQLPFRQFRTWGFRAEPTTNPIRVTLNATKYVHPSPNPPTEPVHVATVIGPNKSMTSLNSLRKNQGKHRNKITPVYNNTEANQSLCDTDIKFMPNGSMPLVALVSAPGSGNTWLRYLVEMVTGIYTGSVYNDKSLRKGGFLGESEPPRNGRIVVVKTHNISRMKSELDGIILLVRNPYNAAVADFNRKATLGNHIATAPAVTFRSKYWPYFAACSAKRWQGIARSCIRTSVKKLVVYYEDLQTDLSQQLRCIVSFLGLPIDEAKIKCAIENSEGNFHRANSLNFDPFTKKIIAVFDRTIEDLWKRFRYYKYNGKSLRAYERNFTSSLPRYSLGNVCKRILRPL